MRGVFNCPAKSVVAIVSLYLMVLCPTAHAEWPLEPIWSTRKMESESLFFIRYADGDAPRASLLFQPEGLIQLIHPASGTVMVEGEDYVVDMATGVVSLTPESRIVFRDVAELSPMPGEPNSILAHVDGIHHIFFSEGHFFHDQQYEISYYHEAGDWESMGGWTAEPAEDLLPKTAGLLTSGQGLKLTLLGDSISYGANSTALTGAPPYMPNYGSLVAEGLRERYDCEVLFSNPSVGGMTSTWGSEVAPTIAAETPDLVVIAFGMNDCSARMPVGDYIQNIQSIMTSFRATNPDVEFVIVASMLANPEWTGTDQPLHLTYRDQLQTLVAPGVALLDMTSTWQTLFTRKTLWDLTGNGVNHPNDFGHRLYAQGLLELLRFEIAPSNNNSDTWGAYDAMDRVLSTYEDVGPPRADRTVGLFYFLWHIPLATGGPWDITKILAKHPDAMQDTDHPAWGPFHAFHHWGESIFGYYLASDCYVLRKHAQMLSDAGVDVIIFDTSNGFLYEESYRPLLDEFMNVRRRGGNTPQVAFLTRFMGEADRVNSQIEKLYEDLYRPEAYWIPVKHIDDCEVRDFTMSLKVTGTEPTIRFDDTVALKAGAEDAVTQLKVVLKPGHGVGKVILNGIVEDIVTGELVPAEQLQASVDPESNTAVFDLLHHNYWNQPIEQMSLTFTGGEVGNTLELERIALLGPSNNTVENWRFRPQEYDELFFKWRGKPLIMGVNMMLENQEILDYFTFRQPMPDYQMGQTKDNMWSWLEITPQHVFTSNGEPEQIAVGVAQNAANLPDGTVHAPCGFQEPNTRGRSYWHGPGRPEGDGRMLGFNFQQQWDRALEEDPPFVFVTGWNEWIAMRLDGFNGVDAPVVFVDAYSEEKNRDCEPVKGETADNYYYQLIENIRRYKGVQPAPMANRYYPIAIDGNFEDWFDVAPTFHDQAGDRALRFHPGWTGAGAYVNQTGRNDFKRMKVARDADFLYFYVETVDPIHPWYRFPDWMHLMIDADDDHKTGWEGYDYIVNRAIHSNDRTILQSHRGDGYHWAAQEAVRYLRVGNKMEIAIPITSLELDPAGDLALNFKWADGFDTVGDVTAFTVNGDAAPNDRYYYRYIFKQP